MKSLCVKGFHFYFYFYFRPNSILGDDILDKLKNKIADIILLFFIAIFIWIISNGILNYDAVSYEYNPFLLCACIAVYLGILFFLRKKVVYYLASFKYLPAILLAVFALVSVLTGIIFRVNPSWDMGEVFNIAKTIAGGNVVENYYLYYYPNNIMITVIYTVVFKIAMILGITDLILAATVFNSFLVTGTAVFIYLAAHELYGKQQALLILIITLLTTPLYLQSAIYYTDSASMFFTALTLYLFLKVLHAHKKTESVIFQILLGISVFTAFETKVTTFILIIALLIYALYRGFKLADIKKVWISFLAFVILLSAFITAKNIIFDRELTDRYQYPPEHWIMMGLDGVGGFNLNDCIYTSSYDSYELKQQADREMIKTRLSSYNSNTFLKHITQKLKYAWTDGVYFAPEKLRRDPVNPNLLHEFVLSGGKYTKYYKYFPQTMHFAMLILITVSAYSVMKCKKNKGIEAALILAVLGIVIFLLIWENRSRYILTMFPVMMILQLSGLDYIIKRKKETANDE